jgi:hypothetical protein
VALQGYGSARLQSCNYNIRREPYLLDETYGCPQETQHRFFSDVPLEVAVSLPEDGAAWMLPCSNSTGPVAEGSHESFLSTASDRSMAKKVRILPCLASLLAALKKVRILLRENGTVWPVNLSLPCMKQHCDSHPVFHSAFAARVPLRKRSTGRHPTVGTQGHAPKEHTQRESAGTYDADTVQQHGPAPDNTLPTACIWQLDSGTFVPVA